MKINFTDRQEEAHKKLWDDNTIDLMYGGAKGGGKSFWLCLECFNYCSEIHNKFSLVPVRNIPHIGWMGRKQATDFTATTLQTWQEIIPEHYYKICGATDRYPKHILLFGTLAIDFGGLDHREDINKFNSAEYGFIALDQAEETTRDDVAFLRASRRLKLKGKPLPYKGLFTANPAQCWLKDDFILNPRPGCVFVQALPSDNPFLPNTYIETLRESFSHRPELLEAYLYGSWDSLEGSDQVIKDSWLRDAQGRTLLFLPNCPRVVCDPARFGDDETVIYYGETTDVLEMKIMGQSSVVQTAHECIAMGTRHGRCPIIVEEDGVGGGVVDVIQNAGYPVISFKAAGSANDSERYGNMRSESWSKSAKMLSDGKVELKLKCMSRNDVTKLISQLTSLKYKFRSGRTYIEGKDDIKARLGGSPDRADAYNLLLWSYDKVPCLDADRTDNEEEEQATESYQWETCI